jgi:hypothetical protein
MQGHAVSANACATLKGQVLESRGRFALEPHRLPQTTVWHTPFFSFPALAFLSESTRYQPTDGTVIANSNCYKLCHNAQLKQSS